MRSPGKITTDDNNGYSFQTCWPARWIRTVSLRSTIGQATSGRDCGKYVEAGSIRIHSRLCDFAENIKWSIFDNGDRYFRLLQEVPASITIGNVCLEFRMSTFDRLDLTNQGHVDKAAGSDVVDTRETWLIENGNDKSVAQLKSGIHGWRRKWRRFGNNRTEIAVAACQRQPDCSNGCQAD